MMAWKYRYVELPLVLCGLAAIAHCSPAAQPASCETYTDEQGIQRCVEDGTTGTPATSGPGVTNNATGIPVVDTSAGASTTGIPVVDTAVVTATSAGPVTTSAGPSTTTGGNGGAAAVNTSTEGVGGVSTEGGQSTATTGGGARLGTLHVSAGAYDRDHTIVSFDYPDGAGKALSLTDSQGVEIPLQYSSATGKASFILTALAAGATADYTINELAAAQAAGVTAVQEADASGNQLFLKIGDSKVFRWTLIEDNFRGAQQQDVRAGYIFPVWTPSGKNVADDYQTDHPHMHGIWSAWTLTTFNQHKVDFWNGYDKTGRVDLKSMDGIWNGPVTGGLIASLVHSDITVNPSVAALNETWIVTVYKTHDDAQQPYFVYDIASTQNTASESELVLETYHYGGFGFRGSEQWTDASQVSYLTSEGHTRSNGDGQRAKWVAQYGTVDGAPAGYAAFDHPTNFRHPQGLRIHPTNPYWSFSACTQLSGGRFEIVPNQPYKSLYRVVAFDGAADATFLNRLYNDFGEPPTVEILP